MFDMLIVRVFWEERLEGRSHLSGSPWKWLNIIARATNMACVVGIAKRMYSDFPTFGIAEFLVCKE